MMTSRGPVVIDWRNAAEGPAALDIALTAVILAEVATNVEHPLASSATTMVEAFVHAVGNELFTAVEQALTMRRHNPSLTATERERLPAVKARLTALRPAQR
ncbi:hypothetical protein [Actinoplanes sp. NPDC051859]|uniref:hypothetical protein n=1 Tax=Actinoplanes sp. NPDC051859 TaxID=3363909 RepID=UPI00378BEABC